MKARELLRSRRTWIIIGAGLVEIAAGLFPNYMQSISEVLRSLLQVA